MPHPSLQPFGPVLPIVRVASVEAAVSHVNANRLALQGCVFTRDVNKAMYVSDAMETGSVQVGGCWWCAVLPLFCRCFCRLMSWGWGGGKAPLDLVGASSAACRNALRGPPTAAGRPCPSLPAPLCLRPCRRTPALRVCARR